MQCSTNGEMYCNGLHLYALCNWGRLQWQGMPAGTICCCHPGDNGNCIAHADEACPSLPASPRTSSNAAISIAAFPTSRGACGLPGPSSGSSSLSSLALYTPSSYPTNTTIWPTSGPSPYPGTGRYGTASRDMSSSPNTTSWWFYQNLSRRQPSTLLHSKTAMCLRDITTASRWHDRATCTRYKTTVTSWISTDCGGCALRTVTARAETTGSPDLAADRALEKRIIHCTSWTSASVTVATSHVCTDLGS